MYYAAIGGIAILIHVIMNHECFKRGNIRGDVDKIFKSYVWAALFYYISDSLWGIINSLQVPILLYIDTIMYYVAMALTVVLLCRYVTAYLRLDTRFGRFINTFGYVFAISEVVILVVNHFVHIFFWIDEKAVYHAYVMRYVALYMQVLLCVLLAFQMYLVIRRASGDKQRRYFTIFLFCVEMTVAIVLQIFCPMLPIYSIGILIGICVINTFVRESEEEAQYNVLLSMADIYYSLHVIDIVHDEVIGVNAQYEVKDIVDSKAGVGATELMKQVMSLVTSDEYVDAALEFTDLTTVADRMKDKKTMSAQFVGKRTGWFVAMFIANEVDSEGRPTQVIYTTRVIEEEKRQEESLIHKSQTDELTGLYNRRAYEEDIYSMDDIPGEFIYIALDVNGLKVVNDTIGHMAGDELIIGASNCMKQALGPYGKLYRTGGDEFVAIEYVSQDKLADILKDFDDAIENWSGNLIDSLSISYGYVAREEHPEFHAPQFASEADKRMYIAKNLYYQKKGIDRRGQRDAHRALCEAYTKILKVNLTDDTYQIINMHEAEKDAGKGFSDSISSWLKEFGRSGQVHADDLEEYLEKTDISYMREYFKEGNSTHIVLYRRKYGDIYKHVMLEMIPANDYAPDNQSLFLYVKNIEK